MIAWRFDGGDQLADALDAQADGLKRPIVIGALTEGAEPIRAAAEARAPRGEGPDHLADHIVISPVSNSSTSRTGRDPETDFAVKIGAERHFFYGLFAEIGSAHQAARPWLRPAFDSLAGQSLGIIGRELWSAVRATAIKHAPTAAAVPHAGVVQTPGGGLR